MLCKCAILFSLGKLVFHFLEERVVSVNTSSLKKMKFGITLKLSLHFFQGSEMRSPLSFRIHFIFSFPWFCNQILPLRHFYLLTHAPSYNSNHSCFILFSLYFLILNPKIKPTKNLLLCWMRSLAFFPLYKEAESYFFFFFKLRGSLPSFLCS